MSTVLRFACDKCGCVFTMWRIKCTTGIADYMVYMTATQACITTGCSYNKVSSSFDAWT